MDILSQVESKAGYIHPFEATKFFGGGTMGIAKKAGGAAMDSNWINIEDYNAVNIHISVVRAAITDISFYLRSRNEAGTVTDIVRCSIADTATFAAVATAGKLQVTTGATSISGNAAVDVALRDLNVYELQVYQLTGTATSSSDFFTCEVRAKRFNG